MKFLNFFFLQLIPALFVFSAVLHFLTSFMSMAGYACASTDIRLAKTKKTFQDYDTVFRFIYAEFLPVILAFAFGIVACVVGIQAFAEGSIMKVSKTLLIALAVSGALVAASWSFAMPVASLLHAIRRYKSEGKIESLSLEDLKTSLLKEVEGSKEGISIY